MITIEAKNAAHIKRWFSERGGIKVWKSINLSNPGGQMITPICSQDGRPCGKPSWEYDESHCATVTDISRVQVSIDKEVKRFRVSLRIGGNGMLVKCSDASTRRIRAAVANAGPGSFYRFDYDMQEAVIYASEKTVPLSEYQP